MAGVPVVLPDGSTGTVDASDVPAVVREQGRVLSPQEHAAEQSRIAQRDAPVTAGDVAKTALSGYHAQLRGLDESVGIPLDRAITGVADFLGGDSARKSTAAYLKSLDDENPILTEAMGVGGNVAGAVGATAALGAAGLNVGALRGVGGFAARAGMAGVENVVQATSHDINEAALGDHAVNGEKLVAAVPGRFIMGAAIGGAFEGVGAAIGKGYSSLARRAAPALEEAATSALGAEVGDVAAGARVRSLAGGEIPRTRTELADILGGEQAAQRGRSAATHAGVVDALAGAQVTEAAGLSARQEAQRGGVLAAGKRSVEAADMAGAEATLESLARGGARVEEAEINAAMRRNLAGQEAASADGAANLARGRADTVRWEIASLEREAPAEVARVNSHYGQLRAPVEAELKTSTALLTEIAAERTANERAIVRAVRDASKEANRKLSTEEAVFIATIEARGPTKEQLISAAASSKPGFVGPRYKPPAALGDMGYGLRDATHEAALERAAEAKLGLGASEASQAHIERLKKIGEGLDTAHEGATKHIGEIGETLRTIDGQRAHDLDIAGRYIPKKPVTSIVEPAGIDAKGTSVHPALKRAEGEVASADKGATAAAENVRKVEAEGKAAVEKARAIGEKQGEAASRRAAENLAEAKAAAAKDHATFEKGAASEKSSMASAHEAQTKKLPKVDTKTDVDPLIKGMSRTGPEAQPVVSGTAAMGSMFSLLHGHPVAAGIGLVTSFAAGKARAIGNLTRARAMVDVARQINRVDAAVREGTALILGAKVASSTATRGEDVYERHTRLPPFEKVAAQVYAQQNNPDLLERNVRAALGELAEHAPQTYAGAIVTTHKANAYLASILPQPQRDPHSLTPQFDKGTVSETAQWDFMQAYATVIDPLSIFKDVHNGSVTESQVGALATVYEPLYDQIRNEVNLQRTSLTAPVDYDRAIHVGQLMGIITDEVLERDFQRAQSQMYKQKQKMGESASGSKSGAGKTSNNMMSASQSIEGGESP